MPKMIFVNLPVRDLAASTAFYVALGGEVNAQFFRRADDVVDVLGCDRCDVADARTTIASSPSGPIGDARREKPGPARAKRRQAATPWMRR